MVSPSPPTTLIRISGREWMGEYRRMNIVVQVIIKK